MFTLNHKIAIYVPSTINVDEKADDSLIREITDNVINMFSLAYGGTTTYNAIGSYVDSNNYIVSENVTIVSAYCMDITEKDIEKATKLCKYIAKRMNQECVSLEIDNTLRFIEA